MYLTIISRGEQNWTALVPELRCVVTAPDRDQLLKLVAESVAVALEDRPDTPATIRALEQVPGDIRAELDGSEDVLFLSPAPMNPVSLEIEAALGRAGVSQAELARRLGTSRSAVNRMLNPFYWGHSVDVLRRVAGATGMALRVNFEAKAS